MSWLWVGLGGAVGAWCRYYIGIVALRRWNGDFPWGTWIINMLGSALLGFMFTVQLSLPQSIYLLMGIGFCGAFTTFSTFCYEAVVLIQRGKAKVAFLYVGSSTIIGFGVAYITYTVSG
ncbi:fluoride efflux transporter CrcB [Paenibacillus sp. 481]|uniref:fluoride efflux transporter CrcB n=1 Tax=Paenibacillus sp. 481 TaxID=2835869 RepID=UPI001E3E3626|nr:fluoride efflux transporter CrcB [Paenibacillus sp. 481]UHA74313.1 fluoride efflux transporter CrcB [Paenibacillus sp. 481]